MSSKETGLPPGLALAWGLAAPSRRGPKPAHSVETIVQAALDLVDAGGITSLSLPKLAARIGVATNALYRYIGSKEELLVLVRDAGWGVPPASIPRTATWRDAARIWTHAVIDGFRDRPWLLDVPVHGAPVTPRLFRWVEVLLQSMTDTGLSDKQKLQFALLLDGYAFSSASLARNLQAARTHPVQSASVYEFLQPRLEQGFPTLASMLSSGAYDDTEGLTGAEVDFGLERILDGIEVFIRNQRSWAGHTKPGQARQVLHGRPARRRCR